MEEPKQILTPEEVSRLAVMAEAEDRKSVV